MKAVGINDFTFLFGGISVPGNQVFLLRRNVVGIVNLKPLAKGHVLVCSRREARRLKDLNEIETLDLWYSALEVQRKMEDIHRVRTSRSGIIFA